VNRAKCRPTSRGCPVQRPHIPTWPSCRGCLRWLWPRSSPRPTWVRLTGNLPPPFQLPPPSPPHIWRAALWTIRQTRTIIKQVTPIRTRAPRRHLKRPVSSLWADSADLDLTPFWPWWPIPAPASINKLYLKLIRPCSAWPLYLCMKPFFTLNVAIFCKHFNQLIFINIRQTVPAKERI